jgi:hypothetical protein
MPLSNVAPNRKGTGDYGRPIHSRIDELGQEGAISRSGSEPDSLLDLYRNNASNGNISNADVDNDIPENMYKPDKDDLEGWIHREKLAKIESEELQAAGINLANARRGHSKSSRRDTSRGRRGEETPASERREEKKPRLAEPALEEEEDDPANWDLRTPDEIAAEAAALTQVYSQPMLRKSGSRIPVLTSSPNPVPIEHLERETPLPRKRTMSNSMSPDDSLSITKTRTRKGSVGSTPQVDEDASTPSKPSSPTKKSKPSTTSPPGTLTNRKTTPATAAAAAAAQRKASTPAKKEEKAPASPPRPSTRGNDMERPRTAVNRPEGDPPWLATMYKPDPMLPPDKQIIPTHARRQQQAQWTEDGSVPKTYDRDFTPIAVHTEEELAKQHNSSNPQSPLNEKFELNTGQNAAWPLKPMPIARSNSGRPGTSGSITGSYSTMPKITSPAIQSPRMGSISSTKAAAPPPRFQEQRPAQPEDDGTVKKGCGCCVVM